MNHRVLEILSVATVLALTALTAHAQGVYRIVGPDGRVSFSDQPPPPNANVKSASAVGAAPASTAGSGPALPLELRQVTAKFPVTLFSGPGCGPCAGGRALLSSRGIPFTEKTVSSNDDNDALKRISGENSLPLLTIGGQQLKGFSDTEWNQFLDAAGYPKTSVLPKGYANPPASPLVALQKPDPVTPKAAAPAEAPTTARAPVPAPAADPGSNPAGIKF
jgi:glutaredoxin